MEISSMVPFLAGQMQPWLATPKEHPSPISAAGQRTPRLLWELLADGGESQSDDSAWPAVATPDSSPRALVRTDMSPRWSSPPACGVSTGPEREGFCAGRWGTP